MIRVELVSQDRLQTYRTTRLAALRDTPLAFGSTYEKESTLTTEAWRDRIARNNSDASCLYLAFDDTQPPHDACGLAGVLVHEDRSSATLFSMWVAPTHRRLGVGRQLVDACIAWSRQHGIRRLDLLVTDWNVGAITFYQGLGFELTGKREPYPNDPRYVEYEMARTL